MTTCFLHRASIALRTAKIFVGVLPMTRIVGNPRLQFKILLCALMALYFLTPTSAQVVDQEDEGEVIIISRRVGEMIDLEERNRFGLFSGVEGFRSARFFRLPDGGCILKITHLDETTGREQVKWVPRTESEKKQIGEYVDHFEEIQAGEYEFVITERDDEKAEDSGSVQKPGQRDEKAYGFGLGFGTGRMSVGSRTNSDFGIILLGRLGLDSRNRFLLVAEVNPLEVESPVMDEAFRAANILLARNIGRNFGVRPLVGLQLRFWSGEERVTSTDSGLAFGIDVGYEFRRTDGFSISPEIVYRFAMIEFEGSVTSSILAFQIVGMWKM